MQSLRDMVVADEEDPIAAKAARLLYETSLLESGYAMENVKDYSGKVQEMIKGALKIEGEMVVDAEPEYNDPPEEAKKEEAPHSDDHDEL